ncbi:hypothetical protein [Pedobacter sp. ASV28]|uniref:hypothetical protein n=1 Tax=Pedobacter sp. ASV28 TaxID=2795123 RepID=UPI0018EDEF22|nr:hypothetical protein [Pedobacter sp. ASV28]
MNHLVKILIITILLAACGQNTTKQKELELKEKELQIKEKELELKEKEIYKDLAIDNGTSNSKKNTSTKSANTYIVKVEKSYFFNSPDLKTIRKGYVVNGEEIKVNKVEGDFGYTIYISPSGKEISGWLLLNDLQKNTNSTTSELENDYKKFIGKWKANSSNNREYYIISYDKGQFSISVDWSKEFTKEMEVNNHMNMLENCAYYVGKLKQGILKAKHNAMSSCDDEPEIILKGENQIIVSNQNDQKKDIYTRQ